MFSPPGPVGLCCGEVASLRAHRSPQEKREWEEGKGGVIWEWLVGKGGQHEGGAFLPLGRSTSLAVKLQDHVLTGPNTNEGNGKGGREWKGGK